MNFHTEKEKSLLESFRQNGGKMTFSFFRDGEINANKSVEKTLIRLLRSGHIERDCSGDFNWICYRTKEQLTLYLTFVSYNLGIHLEQG